MKYWTNDFFVKLQKPSDNWSNEVSGRGRNGIAPYLRVVVGDKFGPSKFPKSLQFAGWVFNGKLWTPTTRNISLEGPNHGLFNAFYIRFNWKRVCCKETDFQRRQIWRIFHHDTNGLYMRLSILLQKKMLHTSMTLKNGSWHIYVLNVINMNSPRQVK